MCVTCALLHIQNPLFSVLIHPFSRCTASIICPRGAGACRLDNTHDTLPTLLLPTPTLPTLLLALPIVLLFVDVTERGGEGTGGDVCARGLCRVGVSLGEVVEGGSELWGVTVVFLLNSDLGVSDFRRGLAIALAG